MHTSHADTHHTCMHGPRGLSEASLLVHASGVFRLKANQTGKALCSCNPRAKGGRAPGFQRQRKAPSRRAGAGGGESQPHGIGQDSKKKKFYFQSKKVLQTVSGFKNVKRATNDLQLTVKVQSGTFTGELSAGCPPAGAQAGSHGHRLPRGIWNQLRRQGTQQATQPKSMQVSRLPPRVHVMPGAPERERKSPPCAFWS